MKKILLFSALLLAASSADAKVRTLNQMKRLGASALQAQINTNGMRKVKSVEELTLQMKDVLKTDELVMFSAEGVGSVFVSRDDDFEAVLGVTETVYDDGKLPDNLRWWMDATRHTLSIRSQQGMGDVFSSYAAMPVNKPNFLTTKWGQDDPYNNACPRISGQLSKTGCLATSMAQVFKYYQYPEKLNGAGGYTYYVMNYSKNEYDEKSTRMWFTKDTYDWGNMVNEYTKGYTDVQATAVANLMRDCGYSVHMKYDLNASGSFELYMPGAIAQNFSYDSLQVNVLYHDFFTDDEWNDFIYSEIAQDRPIIACGNSRTDGGHAFIYSGLQINGKVYVNWGWNGSYDGFYSLKYLRPESGNFADFHTSIVLGMEPRKAEPNELRGRYAHSLWAMDEAPEFVITPEGGAVFTTKGLFNYNALSFVGELYFVLQNKQDPTDGIALFLLTREPDKNGKVSLVEPFYGFNILGEDAVDFVKYFGEWVKPGATYAVTLRSQANNEEGEYFARIPGGVLMYDLTFNAQGQPSKITQIDPAQAVEIAQEVGINKIPATIRRPDLNTYNLFGQRVNKHHRGIAIRDGKKFLKR